MQNFPKVESFCNQLKTQGVDFICESTLPSLTVTVSFHGPFKGKVVLWRMTLATLKYWDNLGGQFTSTETVASPRCPFIEIFPGVESVYPIKVGLGLRVIDEPVIKKTIIMIRNYKRLDVGRIEFGSMHP